MRIKLNETHKVLVEEMAQKITYGNEEWYYLPYWFKSTDKGLEIVSFDKLPEYIKKIIREKREE